MVKIPVKVQKTSATKKKKKNPQSRRMNSPLFYILLYLGLQWIDEENLHWGGQSALLNPLMQMLISSRNTLTDILKIIKYLGILWPSQVDT